MNGHVDDYGRALITVTLRNPLTNAAISTDVWVDTGFTGELLLPQEKIAALDLGRSQSLSVQAELGDGTRTTLDTHVCAIEWFGPSLTVEVIAKAGGFPLLGIGLLHDKSLHIEYEKRTLTID